MLYYGDRARDVAPGDALARLAERLAAARAARGLARHAALVGALVAAGEIAQGLADAAHRARGEDDDDPAAGAAMDVALAVARAVWRSWRSGFEDAEAPADDVLGALRGATSSAGPSRAAPLLHLVSAEGYAHYALYPECYGEAARSLDGGPERVVIGVRSIGTGLAAMVAAACGAGRPVTVRPIGHPFDRRVSIGGALAARLAAAARGGASFAVVDEGPGLSGSSFLSVARWLDAAGAPPERIAFFPAHGGGPGPASSAGVRERWERAPRHLAAFEDVVLPRLAACLGDVAGPVGALEDLSAGRWRALAAGAEARWPPCFAQQERRKYLAPARGGGRLLAAFAGLGRYGELALARARALAEARLAPPVLGLAHGFLVERWVDAAPAGEGLDPDALHAHVARYLAFRARAFPAERSDGAAEEALLDAIRVNASEALGKEAAEAARRFEEGAREAAALPRCAVDAKLEPWEWLAVGAGALLKADAYQHACGHDLVGCQPVSWDVAGAAVELALDARALAAEVARASGVAVPPRALAFHEAAYVAVRLARWTFALACEGDARERARIAAAIDRYRARLSRALA